MPGSSAGGFAEGLWGSIDQQRQRAREDEDRRSAREGNILQLLAEHGTPEIQSLALQGLIQSANPKQWKKGLGGFLGQYEPNPAVGQLHSLLQTPETVTEQRPTDLASKQFSPSAQQAAMTAVPQAPPGNPSGTPYQATPPPQLPGQSPWGATQQGMETVTSQRPRHALLTPEEEYAQHARGKAQGDVEGEVAGLVASGYTQEQARGLIQKKYERAYRGGRGSGFQSKAFEGPDGTHYLGYFDPASGNYIDSDTDQPVAGARPLAKTYRPTYRVLAKPDGRPGLYRIATNGQPEYMQDVPEKAQQIPITNEDGSQTIVPVPPQWSTPGGAPAGPNAAAAAAPPPGAPQAGPPTAPGQAATAPPAGPKTSGAGPSAGIRSKPSPLLSATDNANLGTPMGTHMADVQGRVPLRPEDQQVVQDLDVALTNMARIRELTKALFSDPSGLSKQLSGVTAGYSEAVGEKMDLGWQRKSPLYAELQGLIRGSLAGAARSGGEKGTLSDKDITRYEQSFPDLGEGWADLPDTKAMALARLDQLEQKMKDTRKIYQSGSPAGAGGAAGAAPVAGPGGVKVNGTFKGSAFGYPPSTYKFYGYKPNGNLDVEAIGPE